MADANQAAQAQQAAAAETLEMSEFESLLQKQFKPKNDRAKDAVKQAVQTLAEQALSQSSLVSDDVLESCRTAGRCQGQRCES